MAFHGPVAERGLFTLSADPIHKGHVEIITEAAAKSDELTVAVMPNQEKIPLFSDRRRLALAKHALALVRTATGKPLNIIFDEGLLTDLMQRLAIDDLFRGIRTREDREYEENQMSIHKMLWPAGPNLFPRVRYLEARNHYYRISSSLLKGLAAKHLDVSQWTTLPVQASLQLKLSNIIPIGVMGPMGVGKTEMCRRIRVHLPSASISVDDLLHEMYLENSPGAKDLWREVAKVAEIEVLTSDGSLDGTKFKTAVAEGLISREKLWSISMMTWPHVERRLRERLDEYVKSIRGAGPRYIFIEWAMLTNASSLLSFVNNRVIFVEADPKDRENFLKIRGVDPALRAKFDENFGPLTEAFRFVENRIANDRYGQLLNFQSRPDQPSGDHFDLAEKLNNFNPLGSNFWAKS